MYVYVCDECVCVCMSVCWVEGKREKERDRGWAAREYLKVDQARTRLTRRQPGVPSVLRLVKTSVLLRPLKVPMEGLGPGVIAQVVCSLTSSLSVRVQANNKKDFQGSHYLTTEAVLLGLGLVKLQIYWVQSCRMY